MPPLGTPTIALKSLSISDFRGIDHLELDFCGPDGRPNNLVVLAGPNGCGKTAVLEAALVALNGHKLAVGPRGKRAIRKGAVDFEIRASLWVELGSFDGDDEITVSSNSPANGIWERLPLWYFSSWRAPNFVGAVNVSVGKRIPQSAKAALNRLLDAKQQLTNAAAAQSFPGAKPSLFGNYSGWIAQINEAWETFYPGQGDEFSVGLTDPDEAGKGGFDVFYTRKGSPPIPVDNLSAGQLELFLFLTILVINSDREGIVFIDEPELHLDPQWHAPIVRTLMRLQPKAQFIVATHSPAIYDAAMSFERHFLVPRDDPRAAIWGQVETRS